MRKQTMLLALAGGVTMALAPEAMALNWTFNTLSGKSAHVKWNGGANSYNGSAGIFKWTVNDNSGTSLNNGTVFTFCTELDENVGYNQTYTNYSETPIELLPDSMSGGMGADKARVLSRLVVNYWQTAVNGTTEQRAAFQLAAWEIVYEDYTVSGNTISGDLSVTGLEATQGEFRVVSAGGAAETIAQSWLDAIKAAGAMSVINPGLLGFSSPTNQDQFTFIPLPLPAAMAGLGLVGVMGRRRRNRATV